MPGGWLLIVLCGGGGGPRETRRALIGVLAVVMATCYFLYGAWSYRLWVGALWCEEVLGGWFLVIFANIEIFGG